METVLETEECPVDPDSDDSVAGVNDLMYRPVHAVPQRLPGMIGSGAAMRQLSAMVRRVASSPATVLLTGETGTGKELVARALHDLSQRSSGPFIRVNCGALPESLLESELFGHARGAFTHAFQARTGRFEAAHGGTIFLDEINSCSPQLQVRLLRVLQEQEFERVGDTRTVRVNVRIVAATNSDLPAEVAGGRFREDLYYRLNVIPIYLPGLRERPEDIEELVNFFVWRCAEVWRLPKVSVDAEAMRLLQRYHWPGNIRELQNYIERALTFAEHGQLTVDLLPSQVRGVPERRISRRSCDRPELICRELVTWKLEEIGGDSTDAWNHVMNVVERELIRQVLRGSHGVQSRAARYLGINRNTLHKKISDYALESEAR